MAKSPIIYLTGAPATGKSSVAAHLRDRFGARVFSYGESLREHAALRGISHEDLRASSSKVVRAALIADLDARLPAILSDWCASGPVVIDSHAVTTEIWGLRTIPYGANSIARLGITRIICLMADGQAMRDRIGRDPAGRRLEDCWKLDQLNAAQVALAQAYGHTLGVSVYVIDARAALAEVCAAAAACSGIEAG